MAAGWQTKKSGFRKFLKNARNTAGSRHDFPGVRRHAEPTTLDPCDLSSHRAGRSGTETYLLWRRSELPRQKRQRVYLLLRRENEDRGSARMFKASRDPEQFQRLTE